MIEGLSPDCVFDLTTAFVSIGVVLSSLEDLAGYHSFTDSGLQSWKVCRLNHRWMVWGPLAKCVDFLLSFARFRWIILLRLTASCLLLSFLFDGLWRSFLLFVLGATTIADNVRCPFGLSGAHQMTVVISVALFLASLAPPGHTAEVICVWFIALQGVLSYVIAGWAKLSSPTWRSGEAIVGIMGTSAYGHQRYHQYLQQHRTSALVGAWLTIAFESLFFFVFASQHWLTLVFLGVGVLFHIHNAFLMRLNLFFWAFVGSYPAILFCSFQI